MLQYLICTKSTTKLGVHTVGTRDNNNSDHNIPCLTEDCFSVAKINNAFSRIV